MTDYVDQSLVFNSALETGLRSLCILEAGTPMGYGIQELLAFDHLVVHSGDLKDGPPSLHPGSSHRNGELLVRRPLVQRGLLLMGIRGLLSRQAKPEGIIYFATDLTGAFLNSLENSYIQKLRKRSEWATSTMQSLGTNVFYRVFNSAFDRWASEFQLSEISIGEQ